MAASVAAKIDCVVKTLKTQFCAKVRENKLEKVPGPLFLVLDFLMSGDIWLLGSPKSSRA